MVTRHEVHAPISGSVVTITSDRGMRVTEGETLSIIESMKLEHPVMAPVSGIIDSINRDAGDVVSEGDLLFIIIEQIENSSSVAYESNAVEDLVDRLDEVAVRRHLTTDGARADAVDRAHSRGRLTAREKVSMLVDDGTFREYGTFVIAAQRARRSTRDLIENTPADGLISGVATINAGQVSNAVRTVVLAYDFTVLAGTQGAQNHRKTDRLLDIASRERLPVVLFADGGGGRPGDTETPGKAGLDVPTFASFARLSGSVPLIAIVSGYCFAGNAVLAGLCDVIIATRNAHLGIGGPAMIEGGGLGVVPPDGIGPVSIQSPNGVIDVVVDDDATAVQTAARYLAFFQGTLADWEAPDQTPLRSVIPANRRRVYEVRTIVDTIADRGSALELRKDFGRSIVTTLMRVEGRSVGVLASDPGHGGGALDTDSSDKAARFVRLCDAFGVPIVSLIDTPGIMVGPAAESEATVRHASRLFVAGANASVPIMAFVVRRGYGLGAMAMAGGGFKETSFTVAWPSATVGPMGIEGSVTLGYRKELETMDDSTERDRRYNELVADAYDDGTALNAATWFDVDEVIDPVDTRAWIASTLRTASTGRDGKDTLMLDTW